MCCARHLARLSDDDYHNIVAYLHTLKPSETERQRHPNMPMMSGMAYGGNGNDKTGSTVHHGHGDHNGQGQKWTPRSD